jgi:hypothetical protein
MRRALVVALVVGVLGALAPAAQAARFLGRPWPGGRVTYAVASATLRDQVHIAVRAWNGSGAAIRFVEVPRSASGAGAASA